MPGDTEINMLCEPLGAVTFNDGLGSDYVNDYDHNDGCKTFMMVLKLDDFCG